MRNTPFYSSYRVGGARKSTGFSDLRVFMKHKLIDAPIVSSFKFGFKAPTGEFKNEQGLIPTGEINGTMTA